MPVRAAAPEVHTGQVRPNNDQGVAGRTLRVYAIEDGKAVCTILIHSGVPGPARRQRRRIAVDARHARQDRPHLPGALPAHDDPEADSAVTASVLCDDHGTRIRPQPLEPLTPHGCVESSDHERRADQQDRRTPGRAATAGWTTSSCPLRLLQGPPKVGDDMHKRLAEAHAMIASR
ncbi:hypothetical protein GCM10022248_93810 [Nonomuraea soli]